MRQSMQRRERAQALVWAAVMLPLFLAVVGLAIDGGMLFNARRSLQNVADRAARAGAMHIDERAVRASGRIVLDPATARAAAAAALAETSAVDGVIVVDPQQVVVQVRREVPAGFIQLVGIRTVPVSAVATAKPCFGIAQGSC